MLGKGARRWRGVRRTADFSGVVPKVNQHRIANVAEAMITDILTEANFNFHFKVSVGQRGTWHPGQAHRPSPHALRRASLQLAAD